ncbi:MAG: HPr family phosphocarrier protein [Rhodospirillaceae bacterium]|nr:HPr family phosphocarrier protein [Rhodospirillaceae bacterium]
MDEQPAPDTSATISRTVTVSNQRGLHARAAAKFVKLAACYDAQVTVQRNGMAVGGESIMGLMMLAASPGTSITLSASGPDADAAILALEELVIRKFDED